MTEETRKKFVLWLSMYPDSSHPLDEARFYDFVRESCIRKDVISESDIISALKDIQPNWGKEKIEGIADQYVILIEQLQGFYDFFVENKQVETTKENEYVAKSIDNFVSAIFDLNYHEVYELVQALEGNGDILNFFTVKDNKDYRTVVYTVADIAFTFPISDVRKNVTWVEKNLMGGEEAEGWYAFQYAMERSKDE